MKKGSLAPLFYMRAGQGTVCYLLWLTDDLEVQVLYTPGKGKC